MPGTERSTHPAAHRCTDDLCVAVRAERDQAVAEVAQLRRYLHAVAGLAHDALDSGDSARVA